MHFRRVEQDHQSCEERAISSQRDNGYHRHGDTWWTDLEDDEQRRDANSCLRRDWSNKTFGKYNRKNDIFKHLF